MELNKLDNSSLNGINNNLSHINKSSAAEKVSELNKNSINISIDSDHASNRSNIAYQLSESMNSLATTETISSMLNNQLTTIDNIQEQVSKLVDGSNTAEQIQPDVANFISKYNISVDSITDKISNLEDLKGESTTYFDGAAGAMPLDVDMINSEIASKRSELATTLKKVQEVNEFFLKQAQGVISSEVDIAQESSKIKNIDFGKESSDFSANNINAVAGSLAGSQANAVAAQVMRLLV